MKRILLALAALMLLLFITWFAEAGDPLAVKIGEFLGMVLAIVMGACAVISNERSAK